MHYTSRENIWHSKRSINMTRRTYSWSYLPCYDKITTNCVLHVCCVTFGYSTSPASHHSCTLCVAANFSQSPARVFMPDCLGRVARNATQSGLSSQRFKTVPTLRQWGSRRASTTRGGARRYPCGRPCGSSRCRIAGPSRRPPRISGSSHRRCTRACGTVRLRAAKEDLGA